MIYRAVGIRRLVDDNVIVWSDVPSDKGKVLVNDRMIDRVWELMEDYHGAEFTRGQVVSTLRWYATGKGIVWDS